MSLLTLIITIALIIIIPLIILSLIYKLAKKAFKVVLVIVIIYFILSAFFGINLIQTAKNFAQTFPKVQKLILLKDGNQILAGFAGKLTDPTEAIAYIQEDEIKLYQEYYEENGLKNIKQNYLKLIIIDISAFDPSLQINFENHQVSAETIANEIKSERPIDAVVDRIIERKQLDFPHNYVSNYVRKQYNIRNEQEMRDFLFWQLFAAASQDPLFLLIGFKNKNIIIYPKTITFKFVEAVPLTVFQDIRQLIAK